MVECADQSKIGFTMTKKQVSENVTLPPVLANKRLGKWQSRLCHVTCIIKQLKFYAPALELFIEPGTFSYYASSY